jgi:hypothetical protein
MNQQIIGKDVGSYTFDASDQTVTLSGLSTLKLEQVLVITNVTTNTIIYRFDKPLLGGTIAANVITLTYDTTSMSDTDILQIIIDLNDSDYRPGVGFYGTTGNQAEVTASGEIKVVTPPPTPPVGTTPVSVIEQGAVESIIGVDDEYTITNSKTLTIQRISGGAETSNSGSIIEVFEDPNGDKSVLNLIDDVYVSGGSDQKDLNVSFVGDGTRRIIMRRRNFGGGKYEVTGRWEGYEE